MSTIFILFFDFSDVKVNHMSFQAGKKAPVTFVFGGEAERTACPASSQGGEKRVRKGLTFRLLRGIM
jgi:hypothetical protein